MSARMASLPVAMTPGAVRESADIQATFAMFNRVSSELSHSYRLLEQRVEELSSELEQVDRARLRELEEKERVSERLQSLLDLLPAAVVVLDRRGLVCDCNPAAAEMLNGDIRGKRWVDVIRRAFAPKHDDGHEISLVSGRRVSVETRSLERDLGQLVLLTDQTATRELQDRLSRHQRLTAMGRMMAALAHQIRTPLSAAMLYASNICEAELSVEQTRRFSAKILSRLSHLEQQVKDMLVFVRGDVVLENEICVDELIDSIAAAMEAPMAAAQARWDLHLECDGALRLRCNREVLTGAILNLVNNAIQAAGSGCVVGLRIGLREQRLRISVCDNGPGMDAARLKQLDEDFYTTKAQGTGLGMAVVRAVASAHGGSFEIASTPGEGSCATVVLPVQRESVDRGNLHA
jgi:two-component system, sensor histidine kinase FlrB